MNHVHSPRFDALEARKLLATAHVAVAHIKPAVQAVPLVLDGTLAVSYKASSVAMNADGSSTTTVPVSGALGSLGEVRGAWSDTADSFGDSTGLDTLRLHNAKGTFVLAFNAQNTAAPQRGGPGTIFYEYAQRVLAGTGAYVRASEAGSIEVVSNAAGTKVESIVLHSRAT